MMDELDIRLVEDAMVEYIDRHTDDNYRCGRSIVKWSMMTLCGAAGFYARTNSSTRLIIVSIVGAIGTIALSTIAMHQLIRTLMRRKMNNFVNRQKEFDRVYKQIMTAIRKRELLIFG
jgi:hypothetical protein